MDYLIMLQQPAGEEPLGLMGMLLNFGLPLAVMAGLFYFLLIRPEGKRKKQAKAMLESIEIADEVVTSGGIIGRVIDAKPGSDTIVIETGGDKTRLRVLKSYIIENRTIHEDKA
ncbi:MAG: preprotein translocase subunit YajC [Oscillospiraceae bacterium]|nr:preprotein translocase subunit YajC [Oscillospiraceae bacterium]